MHSSWCLNLRIYMVAEPLEKGLGEDIEKGKVHWCKCT